MLDDRGIVVRIGIRCYKNGGTERKFMTAPQERSLFVQNLFLRKKEMATASLAFIAGVAFLIVHFQSGPSAVSFARAEEIFAKWEASPDDEALYADLREACRKIPALRAKYEASIAQRLLDVKKIDEALEMASRSLERVKDETPFHVAFAQTSLLIARGAYQEALQNSVALKEEIGTVLDLKDLNGERLIGGSVLYAHNLVRIACLQQELKNRPGEKAAWEELEHFLGAGTPVAHLILKSFSEKQLDLTQYIAERKKYL